MSKCFSGADRRVLSPNPSRARALIDRSRSHDAFERALHRIRPIARASPLRFCVYRPSIIRTAVKTRSIYHLPAASIDAQRYLANRYFLTAAIALPLRSDLAGVTSRR